MNANTTITGSATNGITALDSASQLTSLINTQWMSSTALPSGFTASGLCGANNVGIVAYAGKKSYGLTSLANPSAKWNGLKDTTVAISGLVGDPAAGVTMFGDDGKGGSVVAQLTPTDDKPDWKFKPAAPFKIDLMAGDNKAGVVIVGKNGRGGSTVAKSGPDCACEWKTLLSVPFVVECVTGDCTNGFVFYGEGQLMSLPDVTKPLTKLLSPTFYIKSMTGNPKDGLTAFIGNGDFIASCGDLSKGVWIVMRGPLTPSKAAGDAAATDTTQAA